MLKSDSGGGFRPPHLCFVSELCTKQFLSRRFFFGCCCAATQLALQCLFVCLFVVINPKICISSLPLLFKPLGVYQLQHFVFCRHTASAPITSRTQVVCSNKVARKRLARRHSRNGSWTHQCCFEVDVFVWLGVDSRFFFLFEFISPYGGWGGHSRLEFISKSRSRRKTW